MGFIYFVIRPYNRARFGSTYTKIGTIQRRLAWPLRKDDTQIREAFHIFVVSRIEQDSLLSQLRLQYQVIVIPAASEFLFLVIKLVWQ